MVLILSSIFLGLSAIAIPFLSIWAYRLKKENIRLNGLRETDIEETNKLFVEKSENELKLLFQFETVYEEILKIVRKGDIQHTKIVDELGNIRLILECYLKK
jgi:hypothetical protein